MAKYTRTRAWVRWAGSTDDLARVIREADRLVAAAAAGPARLVVRVRLPGLEDDFRSAEEFVDNVSATQLELFESITVVCHPPGESEPSVVFTIRRAGSPAVVLIVEGTDQVWADGAVAAMDEVISAGRATRKWEPARARAFLIVGGVAAVIGWLLVITTLVADEAPDVRVALAIVWPVGLAALAAGLVHVNAPGWLFRPVEVTPPGEPLASDRWKSRTVRAAGALLLLLLGAFVYAVVDRLVDRAF